jgi:segregation and condensation protein A
MELDVTIGQLIAAVQRRMQLMLPLEEPTLPLPAPKILTVGQVGTLIRERLRHQAWFSFEDLLPIRIDRVSIIVTLWAVLELLKRRAIVVEQADLFGPIQIGRGPALHEVDVSTLEQDQPAPKHPPDEGST